MGKHESNNMLRMCGVVAGLALMAGAVASWHYWEVNGLLAFLMGLAGFSLVTGSLDKGNDTDGG
jgi:hypothetical protein